MNKKVKAMFMTAAIAVGYVAAADASPRACYEMYKACVESGTAPAGKCKTIFDRCMDFR